MDHGRVRVAFAALAVAIAVWTLHVPWDYGADTFVNDWLYNAILLGCAAMAAARAVSAPRERAAWVLVALGLAFWCGGDIWWTLHYDDAEVPIPSLADALYLGMYVPLSAAIVLLVRARVGTTSRLLALDGAIGACAIAALAAAVVIEPVLASVEGGTVVARAVTLAYPLCDIVLIGILIEATALTRWRPSPRWAVLAAGLGIFAATDAIYYVQIADGTYAVNGYVDAGWLVAVLLVAVSAWLPDARRAGMRDAGWRELVAPGGFAGLALAVAAYAYWAQLNPIAMALACAALLAVIARMIATFRQNLSILAEARAEAVTDALTGLGNRRRLLADLEARLEGGERHVLVLCDLNGFKHYNDTFGHPAGDALLTRLGGNLAAAVQPHGHAYRMGGDEFCVLLDAGVDPMGLVHDALSEHGEGFTVDAACGLVTLPDEAATSAEGLRVADTRMYEGKRSGRPSAEAQGAALLLRLLAERNPELGEHTDMVAELAGAVADRLGLGPAERETVRLAAALHDVGKLAIPDSILNKPGPLDADEWAFMARHTLIGQRILTATPGLAEVAGLVRASHERLDGSGYPDALAGEAIPLGARVVAVCDAYDAMVTDRPYRSAMTREVALEELRRGAGSQFDPAVVAVFEAVVADESLRARA